MTVFRLKSAIVVGNQGAEIVQKSLISTAIDSTLRELVGSRESQIAAMAICAILLNLTFRVVGPLVPWVNFPLYVCLGLGGIPLLWELLRKTLRGEFGSDLLAGVSILTSVVLGEYLAGSLVVLMLSGGEAVERYAVRRASSVLEALARRMPSFAHRKVNDSIHDLAVSEIAPGDILVVFPHEVCPVDGIVTEGHGTMDEAYLTGEPYVISKTPGVEVLSGAINGERALTIRATKRAVDSRYAKISQVMEETAHKRVHLRRLGEQLGAWYTPIALIIGLAAWWISHDAHRFLSVMVVATPCPLLIAIPVALISAISLAAKRGIIIKDPAILERLDSCRTVILDKTGTLTFGTPQVTDVKILKDLSAEQVVSLVASLEQYSKHPLAKAVIEYAQQHGISIMPAEEVSEPPGSGLTGRVGQHQVRVTGRKHLVKSSHADNNLLPVSATGLECVVLIDNRLVALLVFRDEPRAESAPFIAHLGTKHHFDKTMIVSGDRETEVKYLAARVGIKEVYGGKSPEEKVEIVTAETKRAPTLYIGDGVNDAPALMAATVGIALGTAHEITSEAAGAVILEPSLLRVDELFHLARRMRRIALQSAVGGMALSIVGMGFAASGLLLPVWGAITQEIIDLFAVLNALRVGSASHLHVDFSVLGHPSNVRTLRPSPKPFTP